MWITFLIKKNNIKSAKKEIVYINFINIHSLVNIMAIIRSNNNIGKIAKFAVL